ncbi:MULTISPECIES: acyltransferase family protein [Prochlorococcus]|uniref:Predicted membrane associated acyltransferase n=1 Tax=Prochlorococcus marinus (strain SARG / CCMP1375 / SS120) TaxID=167539 RepID=Q7VAC8_PROMA|nr:MULTISPECIES: acyltransferase family protein [Prochlorococcus]AAQ00580.1 Predicted membrane associated acyltransferase [Prochlorococcus marinus subsp. marinus str. CCMP1375]KGG10932.1 putative membrane associated acyltransferase [Prochlorococcus marinus str. LG]KGG20516.1 putative membrane associated acyltransferase [Prochlorococcus marinus str. SS2]KGG24181.1 putative membrane associated acyltransferase [Prochlorococcus marinus str. SS35]KGG31561.1 putative membrane associated acyltransfer
MKSKSQYDLFHKDYYEKENLSTKGFRPEINGLRAIAVIAVIINHINNDLLPSGFLGVDIFFVISGYVITSSLATRQESRISEFILGFYERRLKRILPALLFYVLIMFFVISLFDPQPVSSYLTGLFSTFGFSNIHLFVISNNYFAETTLLNPFTQTWSLAVEEQFYLIFPFLTWFSGFGNGSKNGYKYLGIILIFFAFISLIGFYHFLQININAAYYLMPFRFWEIAAGSLLFIYKEKLLSVINKFKYLKTSLIFIALILIMFSPGKYIFSSTLAIILFTCLLIIRIKMNDKVYKILTTKLCMNLGLISYSLYLWHWGVISISKWTVGIHWWTLPFQLYFMYFISTFSYDYIELPIRKSKYNISKLKSIYFSILCVITTSIFLVICFIRTPRLSILNSLQPINKKLFIGKHNIDIDGGYSSEYISATYGSCHQSDLVKSCYTASKEADLPTILLIGDSHAGHLIPLIGALHNLSGVGVYVSSPGPYPTTHFTDKAGNTLDVSKERFRNTNEAFENRLPLLKENDIIVLSSRLDKYFIEPIITKGDFPVKHYSDSLKEIEADESLIEWTEKVRSLAERVKKLGIHIVIVSPLPVFEGIDNPPPQYSCLEEWFRPYINEDCKVYKEEKNFLITRIKPITSALKEISLNQSNVYIYDLFDKICPNKICLNKENNEYIYSDTNHISYATAKHYSNDLLNFLKENNLIK